MSHVDLAVIFQEAQWHQNNDIIFINITLKGNTGATNILKEKSKIHNGRLEGYKPFCPKIGRQFEKNRKYQKSDHAISRPYFYLQLGRLLASEYHFLMSYFKLSDFPEIAFFQKSSLLYEI